MKKILSFIVIILFLSSIPNAASQVCARFRGHLSADLPLAITKNDNQALPIDLIDHIFKWKNDLPFLKDKVLYEEWISCIRKYIFLDTDKDGVPDWSAIVDGKPSRTLFPLDHDIDGDGISNLRDENPYKKDLASMAQTIPKHLAMNDSNSKIQKKIVRDFGILVINHSDKHHRDVMKMMNETFELKSVRQLLKRSHQIKIIYAMKGRNPEGQIAAYHPSAYAISLPGISRYGGSIPREKRCQLMAALLHELGHAYLFEHMNVEQLIHMSSRYGHWQFPKISKVSIMDKIFQQKYTTQIPHENFVSDYAKENVHEWFAENFAAYIWQKHLLSKAVCPHFNVKQTPSLYSWFEKTLSNVAPNSFNY